MILSSGRFRWGQLLWAGLSSRLDGSTVLKLRRHSAAGMAQSGAHTAISPEGLTEVLNMLRNEYGNPAVVITENELLFPTTRKRGASWDWHRVAYLRDHLGVVHRALAEGCNLKGYFVWSLLDNWEWTSGYDQRYGLVYVDFESQERTPKEWFHWYSNVIRSGSYSPTEAAAAIAATLVRPAARADVGGHRWGRFGA